MGHTLPFQKGGAGKKERVTGLKQVQNPQDKLHEILRLESNPLWLDALPSRAMAGEGEGVTPTVW